MFRVTTRKHFGLWLVFSYWAVVNTDVSSLEQDLLNQRTQYDTIESDTTTKPTLNTKPTTNKMVDEKEQLLEDLAFYRNATFPGIILYKATAKRDKDNVEVEFDLVHSSKIYVMRIQSLELQKKFMESTQDLGKFFGNVQLKRSRVSLILDTCTTCLSETRFAVDAVALLILPDDNSPFTYSAKVDICKYDKILDKNQIWQTRSENSGMGHSQNLEIPKLKIVADPGDAVFIQKGENPSFEIEMRLTPNTRCTLSCRLYDWQSKKYVVDVILLQYSKENGLEISNSSSQAKPNSNDNGLDFHVVGLLDVTVLSYEETIDSDDVDIDSPEKGKKRQVKHVDAKVRLTVDIGSKKMSGHLHIGYRWRQKNYRKRQIIRQFDSQRTIQLRLPYKLYELPQNHARLIAPSMQCNKKGNIVGKSYGKNCTIECVAMGTNIKSIFIIKSPYRFPVKTSSYVIKSTSAYVIQDVGPASEDVEGDYWCTVVFGNGKTKSKELSLTTTGFTNVTDFTMEDFGNSTSRLVCTVYGHPPLNISIAIYDADRKQQRLDNKVGSLRSIEAFDNRTTRLSLLICNDELQYPKGNALCKARGDRGYDNKALTPSDFLNVYNPFKPKIIEENSTVVKGLESQTTTTIFCLVTSGGKPVDVMVTNETRGSRFRIDHNPENVRNQHETDEGNTLFTLTVPNSSIEGERPWLYCGAENEFGEDWFPFYLRRYGFNKKYYPSVRNRTRAELFI